jgi:hypothetical protein
VDFMSFFNFNTSFSLALKSKFFAFEVACKNSLSPCKISACLSLIC